MSCPKTDQLMLDYFSADTPLPMKEDMETHLSACPFCQAEMEQLVGIQTRLKSWEEQSVPGWNRAAAFAGGVSDKSAPAGLLSNFFSGGFWQWAPTASSFAMLCLLLFNTTVASSEQGFSVSFGSSGNSSEGVELASRLDLFEAQQSEQLNALVARMEDRQDSNNLRLMQAVLEQSQQATAESVELVYSYFERQREMDMQNVQVGYQQLADSDFETIRSLQQLANYVSFDSVSR